MRTRGGTLRGAGLLLSLGIAAGVGYGLVGQRFDERLAPPESEMRTVGGRRVHLVCTGEGPRTFVLDAGLGGWSLFWEPVQSRLSGFGRVYSFDRAGFGWSQASERGHDAVAAAEELHEIVREAHLPTPFVYVGHSLGANFAQVYCGMYPRDVEALVLLEPGQPEDLLEDFHGTREAAFAVPERGAGYYAAALAALLGVTRLAGQLAPGRSFPEAARPLYRAGISRPSFMPAVAASRAALPRTAYECRDLAGFGSVPVLVLHSSEPREPEGKETVADVRKWREGYLAYLASLAAKSSAGVGPIEVPNSTHKSMVLGSGPAEFVVSSIARFAAGPAANRAADERPARPRAGFSPPNPAPRSTAPPRPRSRTGATRAARPA